MLGIFVNRRSPPKCSRAPRTTLRRREHMSEVYRARLLAVLVLKGPQHERRILRDAHINCA
jgi:hypothetical protein